MVMHGPVSVVVPELVLLGLAVLLHALQDLVVLALPSGFGSGLFFTRITTTVCAAAHLPRSSTCLLVELVSA
mgnify:CR=1 FL=1